jgi:hypothetical protein
VRHGLHDLGEVAEWSPQLGCARRACCGSGRVLQHWHLARSGLQGDEVDGLLGEVAGSSKMSEITKSQLVRLLAVQLSELSSRHGRGEVEARGGADVQSTGAAVCRGHLATRSLVALACVCRACARPP